ncbi:MAG TPA: glycosyltransferase family 87 protein [Flavobacterium sp.]|nr:glycosyltransferase family 87 protein [Flavobacterium sp.]
MIKIQEKYYALISVALLCVFFIYKAVGFEPHDFANYYFGGYFLGQHHFTSDIYFPYWFNTKIVALGYQPAFTGFAPNTPFLALLFYPLSFLSLASAKLVFNIISVSLFIYSLKRLVSFYNINAVYVLFIPVLFLVPIRNEIMFGQVYLLLFFFLAESWLAYEKKQLWKTATYLSLAILLKVFPILLVVIFLFKKQWKFLGYTLLFCLILASSTLIFCGLDVWGFYTSNVLSKAFNGGIASAYVDNYQSVFMFLKRLLVFDATENSGGFLHNSLLFSAVILAFKIKLIAIGYYITKKGSYQILVLSYWILAMILISPYGSTYTFVLMLFPFFALVKSDLSKVKKAALLILLFVLNNVPLSFFMESPFPMSYSRLFVLIAFFMIFLSVVYQMVNWKMVSLAAVVALLVVVIFKTDKHIVSAYALTKDSPLLIYDYKIENNKLTYFYWNQNGENVQSIPFKASNIVEADLTQNQIYFYGKKIDSDSGNKRKPIVIDGKTLLYLSDYDRGIGFYTLRKIQLP